MTAPIEIRPAKSSDLPAVLALLESARLPLEGVDRLGRDLVVAVARDRVVGAVGMERHGGPVLLRSLVVAPEWRARGLGARLCDALVSRALADGLREVWLLTETAEAFFSRRGFETVGRDDAPEPIRQSDEFSRLCPGTATLMRKRLDGSAPRGSAPP